MIEIQSLILCYPPFLKKYLPVSYTTGSIKHMTLLLEKKILNVFLTRLNLPPSNASICCLVSLDQQEEPEH